MKKVKKPKRVINNQVVAYYIEKKWDTQLDTLEIQRKRVEAWVAKAGCEIIFEVVDQNGGKDLARAFEVAAEEEGSVIVADVTRAGDTALDYFNSIESEDNPIIFTDMEIYKPVWKEYNNFVGLIFGTKMTSYENYISHCEEWCA